MLLVLKLVAALLLGLGAVVLCLYGILLIGAAASGSSDTEPSALVSTGALCFVVALVPGWLAWRLLRGFYRE